MILVLYAVEHGITMEPMMGKWASSRVDLGYTELFLIPEMTSVFISSCDSVFGDSLLFHQENRGSLRFDWEFGIALHATKGNQASCRDEGDVSLDFSSWGRNLGIISGYSGDGHSKLHLVQRSQDSCLVMTDTSGI